MRRRHLALLGPTGSGKSATAILLAERLGGEVVNCDSMLVYRGLNIGTAKPTSSDLSRVPHHLIDCLDLADPCGAAAYVALATSRLAEIEGRGRIAVLAGGTGLYARSLIYGLTDLPADPALAAELQQSLAGPDGLGALRAELTAHTGTADAIPTQVWQNPRRLLRAVEVLRLTSEVPWRLHPQRPPTPQRPFDQYVLLPDMAVLKPRIAARTAAMLRAGWIDETRALMRHGLLNTPTARQALGYRDIAEFLAGRIPTVVDLADTIDRHTIAYARRQRTWFRHQHPGAILVVIRRPTSPDELAEAILRHRELAEEHDGTGEPVPSISLG